MLKVVPNDTDIDRLKKIYSGVLIHEGSHSKSVVQGKARPNAN